MENTPKEIVVTVPESLAGISIRKDIHYSDDTVISIRVEEHDPGRYTQVAVRISLSMRRDTIESNSIWTMSYVLKQTATIPLYTSRMTRKRE